MTVTFKKTSTFKKAVSIILLLIVGMIAGYQFQKYRERSALRAFFNIGETGAPVSQKDFFNYGVDEKQSGKKP
jgi:hypothetical protein